MNRNNLLILGAVGVGIMLLANREQPVTAALAVPAAPVGPTFKPTASSTIPEMIADLQSWASRNDPNWGGKEPKILSLVMALGEPGIRKMHFLLWDAWQPGHPENWVYSVDEFGFPKAWNDSVGKWWELFAAEHNLN